MSALNAMEVQRLVTAVLNGEPPEHPTIERDWSKRLSADQALANPYDKADSQDEQRRAALDEGEKRTIRAAVCQAATIAADAFCVVKQRYLFDDIYYPVARETYLAALILSLDELLPARFRADIDAMRKKPEGGRS